MPARWYPVKIKAKPLSLSSSPTSIITVITNSSYGIASLSTQLGVMHTGEPMEISQVVEDVRKRAGRTRSFGKSSIIGIIIVVGSMISFFTVSGIDFGYGMRLSSSFIESDKKPSELVASEQQKVVEAITILEAKIENLERQIESQEDLQNSILLSISLSVVRIASVFLAVYLIQILVGFTRYQFRIADHLDATADAFELSEGDPEKLAKVINAISPQHIEFGKMPSTPTQDSLELIRELIKKVPSK
jgi:amino acid transporter